MTAKLQTADEIEALPDDGHVVLGLLEAVDRETPVTQRSIAADLGIALGLVNLYLKRCVHKGYIKIVSVPKRRFAYYLTPQGFSEKSRLTARYLNHSLSAFREARSACDTVVSLASQHGWTRLALFGASDLAEITLLCAPERLVTVVGVFDQDWDRSTFHGTPVLRDPSGLRELADAAMVTHITDAGRAFTDALEIFGPQRTLIPAVLVGAVDSKGVHLNASA
jgi:DNA-binding MarR family transcriptional regulator